MNLTESIISALSVPFSEKEISWKVQAGFDKDPVTKKPKRGMVVAYIDARNVMDRLDAVVGSHNWWDEYEVVEAMTNRVSILCRLTVCGITKSDVGTGTGDDPSNLAKGACSDALKRTAVKFGLGRFLYDLPRHYVDLDENGHFQTPRIPANLTWQGNRVWINQELDKTLAKFGINPNLAETKEWKREAVLQHPRAARLEGLSLLEVAELINEASATLAVRLATQKAPKDPT